VLVRKGFARRGGHEEDKRVAFVVKYSVSMWCSRKVRIPTMSSMLCDKTSLSYSFIASRVSLLSF
jgi:hypothetical protein